MVALARGEGFCRFVVGGGWYIHCTYHIIYIASSALQGPVQSRQAGLGLGLGLGWGEQCGNGAEVGCGGGAAGAARGMAGVWVLGLGLLLGGLLLGGFAGGVVLRTAVGVG